MDSESVRRRWVRRGLLGTEESGDYTARGEVLYDRGWTSIERTTFSKTITSGVLGAYLGRQTSPKGWAVYRLM